MDFKETNYLEDLLAKFYAKNEPRERVKLSASDTGCNLHTQLKMWKVKPDRELSVREAMTFDLGNIFHYFLQKRLKDAGMEGLEDELELEDDLFIGHIDKTSLEDKLFVVNEFKSTKDYALDEPQVRELPNPQHVKQATNYVRMLKAKVGDEKVANWFRIFYLAKCFDDGHRKFLYQKKNPELAEGKTILRLKEYTVAYDPKLADEIVEDAKKVRVAIDTYEPMSCSMWQIPYHRQSQYNQYLSFCSSSPAINKARLDSLLKETNGSLQDTPTTV